jgi:BD-FAE protein
VTKPLIFALCVVFAFGGLNGQTPAWQPSTRHTQFSIWPGAVPDAQPAAGTEVTATAKNLVAGRPWDYVGNVSRPTMTVYSPTGKNTGTAVVVFPGGGYQILAIDLEGTEVCDWLTSKGITCVLSKYRVPNSGMHWDIGCQCQLKPKAPTALEDAQRTMGLVRLHAAEWHIDPHKIGVMGFSAGWQPNGGHCQTKFRANSKLGVLQHALTRLAVTAPSTYPWISSSKMYPRKNDPQRNRKTLSFRRCVPRARSRSMLPASLPITCALRQRKQAWQLRRVKGSGFTTCVIL